MKKYSLAWWFLNGKHFKKEGYGNERLARNYFHELAFQFGFWVQA